MRILIATSHRAIVGGIETYLRALLPLLRERGMELGLVCANGAGEAHDTIDGHCPGLPVWVAGDPAGVSAAAESWQPDVVYNHGLTDAAADAVLASRLPTVYYAHGYAGMCISGSKCHAFPASQTCNRPLGPKCLALYFPRRCGGLNPVTAWQRYRTERRRQRLLPAYRAVLAASRHMTEELIRNGVPPERAIFLPLFPPETRPDPHPPAAQARTGRVLFVGRLRAQKGWRHLLETLPRAAAALGRHLTLIVAGDGPDRGAFEAEARRRAMPAEFLGWVSADRRDAEMRRADVLAVPSVWPEPFGLVGIEAGCVGLPAVGFAVGGIPDWLISGVSGELAPGKRPDPHELAQALVRALADETHWQKLRIGAWETAQRFTPEGHVERLIPVLESAAIGKPSG